MTEAQPWTGWALRARVARFAQLMDEELAREEWGAIEPGLFGLVGEDRPAEGATTVQSLRRVLARTLERYEGV